MSNRSDLGIAVDRALRRQRAIRRADISQLLRTVPSFADDVLIDIWQRAQILHGGDSSRLVHREVAIQIPALKRLRLKNLRGKYGKDVITGQWYPVEAPGARTTYYIAGIERDDSTEEPITLRLATVVPESPLRGHGQSMNGSMFECRVMALRTGGKLLGAQHAVWLEEHQSDPGIRDLTKAWDGHYATLLFPGTIVTYEDGSRAIPEVSGNHCVGANFHYVSDGCGPRDLIAIATAA